MSLLGTEIRCIVWETSLNLSPIFYRPSAIRNLQPSVSDPKYDGVATSRSHIFEDEDDDDDDDDNHNDGDNDSGVDKQSDNANSPPEDDSASDEAEEMTDSAHDHKKPSSSTDIPLAQDLTSSLKHTRDLDRLKGQAVSKQLVCLLHHYFPFLSQISRIILSVCGIP
jgi:hypothetical protein